MANNTDFAMMEVYVTCCGGIVPIEGAKVTLRYKGLPSEKEEQIEIHTTDKNGRAEPFKLRTKRAKIRDRFIDFPRNVGCFISVSADGFIPCFSRDVPVFSGITVRRSFDLIAATAKSEA